MEEQVTTVSGLQCNKSDCRIIDKKYYLIGNPRIENSGDVYLINERYIRYETGRIVFNHTIQEYQTKNPGIVEGIIRFNGSEPVFGHFSLNGLKNVILHGKSSGKYYCINQNIIPLDYRERKSTGEFYHISSMSAYSFNEIKRVSREYKESLKYDSRNILSDYIQRYESSYNPEIKEHSYTIAKILNGLSFGIEFETTKGTIPKERLNHLPLIPLRDGSIPGLEYVTIPLSGEKGVQAAIDSITELKKRTRYDNSCSLHLHIGNIPRTKDFLLAFYKISSFLQEEMFSMFPLYKKYNFGVKRKNYSKPFSYHKIDAFIEPSIDVNNEKQLNENFNHLFSYLSEGTNFNEYNYNLNNINEHPRDPNGNQKWNINTRYYAVNLIPIIFGNKKTVEFRIHTPTYDVSKVMLFLMLQSSIINFTIKYSSRILKEPKFLSRLTLSSVFLDSLLGTKDVKNNIKSLFSEEMDNYIYSRKQFIEEKNSLGIIAPEEDDFKFMSLINYEQGGTKNQYMGRVRPPERPMKIQEVKKKGISFSTTAFIPNSYSNTLISGISSDNHRDLRWKVANTPTTADNDVEEIVFEKKEVYKDMKSSPLEKIRSMLEDELKSQAPKPEFPW
jgi:hypothetical protein